MSLDIRITRSGHNLKAGGLDIWTDKRNCLSLGTCENIAWATKAGGTTLNTSPTYQTKPAWRVSGSPKTEITWEYSVTFKDGFTLTFMAHWERADTDTIRMRYTLLNRTGRTVHRAAVFACLVTTNAPDWTGYKRFSEMLGRVSFNAGAARLSQADTAATGHPQVLMDGEPAVRWAVSGYEKWWKTARNIRMKGTAIVLVSRRGERLEWDNSNTLLCSSNVGDKRCCLHDVPEIGTIEPGKSGSVDMTFRVRR